LGEPKYLILDEPANGLDPEGIAWLRSFIQDYSKDGRGVLVSSHLLSEMSLMAENVVVIGKGKLIADTSIEKLIAGAGSSVFVRVSSSSKLVKALNDAKLKFEKSDKGLTVAGVKTDYVGQLAQAAGVTVLELSQHTASLEKAFLELTEGTEEFHSGAVKEAKK
jgi:ABC-2 type transport system ATP-binding protein